MQVMRLIMLAITLCLTSCVLNPVHRQTDTPLQTAPIERARYLGLWHEQARLPNSFERGCVRATAEYALRSDGLISVVNTCFQADGRQRMAEGRARESGAPGEGRLKVSFFGPFWADYWVLERADDYSWSIVGEGQGRYLWVLTRSASITPEERAEFEQRIVRLGFRPDDLEWAASP